MTALPCGSICASWLSLPAHIYTKHCFQPKIHDVWFKSLSCWNCTVLEFALKRTEITSLRLVVLEHTRVWLLCSHLSKEPHRGGKHNKKQENWLSVVCFLISQKTNTWTNHNEVSSSDFCAYFHLFWGKKRLGVFTKVLFAIYLLNTDPCM